jgi:hypothetical protein
MSVDPILATLMRYGLDAQTAQLTLACARMAQVLVYGEIPPGPVPEAVPDSVDGPPPEGADA